MRHFLLAATIVAGFGGLAHAQSTLPSQGLNAGSFSGSSATIGNSNALDNPWGMQAGASVGITTTGHAISHSDLDLGSSHSGAFSSGTINGFSNTTGTVSASRSDQAFTSGGYTVTAPLADLTYSNNTSALSGQALSATIAGPGSVNIGSSGYDHSQASLGLPGVSAFGYGGVPSIPATASAYSQGQIDGTATGNGSFSGQRLDNSVSNVSFGARIGSDSTGIAGNVGAEANAGHLLQVATVANPQAAWNGAHIEDGNSAGSSSSLDASLLGQDATSVSHSSDSLSGSISNTQGNMYGSSSVNAQTNMQLSGSLDSGPFGFSLDAGGLSGYHNKITQ